MSEEKVVTYELEGEIASAQQALAWLRAQLAQDGGKA